MTTISTATRRLMLRQMGYPTNLPSKFSTDNIYVLWALERAEEGANSDSLWILAGLHEPLYSSEVDHYFARALEELGEVLPDKAEILWFKVRCIAEEILEGSLAEGAGNFYIDKIARELEYPSELATFHYLESNTPWDEVSDEHEVIPKIREAARQLLSHLKA